MDARTDRTIVVDARVLAVATVCLGWLIAMSALAAVYVLRDTGDLWDPLAWGILPTGITAVLVPFKGERGKVAAGRHRVPNGGA